MGFHCVVGTKTRTPEFHFNHCGSFSWSGKELPELTEYDVWLMRQFIEIEGYRQGYNDGMAHAEAKSNPFHPAFLFGEPHKRWTLFYHIGGEDGTAGRQPNIPDSPDMPMHEHSIWTKVIAELEEVADGFERSYRKLGVEKHSSLRGIAAALCGWFNQSPAADFFPIYDWDELQIV